MSIITDFFNLVKKRNANILHEAHILLPLFGEKRKLKSLRLPYGSVALSFLRRHRQLHPKLLPVPMWSPDSEGRHLGEMIPCPLASSHLYVTVITFFHFEFNNYLFGHLAKFYFIIFD